MQLIVTRANTLQAFSWIKNGWRLFTLKPAVFMGMSGVILSLSLVANFVPVLSYFIIFLMPFLSIGYYQVASQIEQDKPSSVSDVFQYLGQMKEYFVLLKLALLSIAISIPSSMAALSIMEAAEQQIQPQMSDLATMVLFLGFNFMITAFSVPAAWVSPKTPLGQLVGQSLSACWQNVLPLTLLGLIMVSIWLISAPILVVGWLVAMAMATLSLYQAFLDIYQPLQTADETPSPMVEESQDTQQEQAQDNGVEQESTDRTDHRQD